MDRHCQTLGVVGVSGQHFLSYINDWCQHVFLIFILELKFDKKVELFIHLLNCLFTYSKTS